MSLVCVAALVLLGEAAVPGDLDPRARAEVAGFRGRVSVFARNVDTGATYALRADDLVRTASTIKLPILVEAFARVAEGKVLWDEALTLAAEARVGGSGILSEFSPGLRLTLRDAVHLMIVISDNTATKALDHMRGDVGIYSARGRIAMALYCDEMPEVLYRPDNPGLLLISRLSVLLAEGLATLPLP